MSEKLRKRASKGGHARAAKLTPEERRQIGIAGSLARWGKKIPAVRYGSADQPLRLGATELPCVVLDDGRKVLLQKGFLEAIGLPGSGTGPRAGQRGAELIERLTGGDGRVEQALRAPILFRVGRTSFYGYEAGLLKEVCAAVSGRRMGGKPTARQARVIAAVDALSPWLSTSDVDRLVEQAAEVESTRRGEELARPLATLVQDELRDWVVSFPPVFYEELYRLCELDYRSSGRPVMPAYLGELTDDVIYKRLGPSAKAEMDRLLERRDTDPVGEAADADPLSSPRLREHLASVIALMKISRDYEEFERHLDTALPRWEES